MERVVGFFLLRVDGQRVEVLVSGSLSDDSTSRVFFLENVQSTTQPIVDFLREKSSRSLSSSPIIWKLGGQVVSELLFLK